MGWVQFDWPEETEESFWGVQSSQPKLSSQGAFLTLREPHFLHHTKQLVLVCPFQNLQVRKSAGRSTWSRRNRNTFPPPVVLTEFLKSWNAVLDVVVIRHWCVRPLQKTSGHRFFGFRRRSNVGNYSLKLVVSQRRISTIFFNYAAQKRNVWVATTHRQKYTRVNKTTGSFFTVLICKACVMLWTQRWFLTPCTSPLYWDLSHDRKVPDLLRKSN